jgi:hypothetical protein
LLTSKLFSFATPKSFKVVGGKLQLSAQANLANGVVTVGENFTAVKNLSINFTYSQETPIAIDASVYPFFIGQYTCQENFDNRQYSVLSMALGFKLTRIDNQFYQVQYCDGKGSFNLDASPKLKIKTKYNFNLTIRNDSCFYIINEANKTIGYFLGADKPLFRDMTFFQGFANNKAVLNGTTHKFNVSQNTTALPLYVSDYKKFIVQLH